MKRKDSAAHASKPSGASPLASAWTSSTERTSTEGVGAAGGALPRASSAPPSVTCPSLASIFSSMAASLRALSSGVGRGAATSRSDLEALPPHHGRALLFTVNAQRIGRELDQVAIAH